MIHFSIPDASITKDIVCAHLVNSSEHLNIIDCLVSMLQSCQARPTSQLLGCAETASDCLHTTGHYDLQCSGSTSEIPPLAMEVLPNPLDSKTSNRLVCRHRCCSWCCCGFPAVSYSPLSGPNLSINLFLLPTLPMLPSFQHPLQRCLRSLLSSVPSTCASRGDLLQQALLGAGPCSRKWL